MTVRYDEQQKPVHIDTVVLSTQHSDDVAYEDVVADMKAMALTELPEELINNETRFFINPTGRFVIGGPQGDCGLTGRKCIVDTYGGSCRHGGGALSGKDASKVDRSAAYAARYVAKNIVAAKLASRCEVQIAYAIGVPEPVSVAIDTFGTSILPETVISQALPECFDLSPLGIIEMLELQRPIFTKTAFGGHFGRTDPDFLWERCDRVEALHKALATQAQGVTETVLAGG